MEGIGRIRRPSGDCGSGESCSCGMAKATRCRKRMAAVEIPTFIPEGTIVKEFDPPAEPELSDKDKKKEAKKHRDANKRLRKESGSVEHATEYSGSVLEIYREKMKEGREFDSFAGELNTLDEIEETEEAEEEQGNDVDVLPWHHKSLRKYRQKRPFP